MESNGAIICFQKYTIGWNGHPNKIANPSSMLLPSPLCIGYFNRVDVKPIDDFRDYVKQASKHEANRVCSRNQLLIRKFMPDGDKDSRDYEILHRSIKLRQEGDLKRESRDAKLPFVDEDDNEYAFACCSLISISRKTHGCSCKSLREISFQVLDCLKYATNDACVKYGIFGVLGTEDMCLIVLSNSFQAITDTVSVVEGFCCGKRNNGESQDNRCGACHTDNMHSILMLNTEKFETRNKDESSLCASLWGKDSDGKEPRAEIRFSLRTSAGLKYLNEVANEIKVAYSNEDIELFGCSGEYDALLRCPAKLLVPHLLGNKGKFGHNKTEYHKGVYQSETFLYPFGLSKSGKEPPIEHDKCAAEMYSVVDAAVKEIKRNVNSIDSWSDFDYLELPLWRLLKDFWNFASFPMDLTLREDQEIQFKVSINAIRNLAEMYGKGLTKDRGEFLEEFNKIITAISGSLQAASQRSRWNFQEQQSYIQNVGSYYKILSTYYGLVKDYIQLIYHIERKEDVEQPLLIPIITFGVTPIIKSYPYDSFWEEENIIDELDTPPKRVTTKRKARLIHIILPYQAMAKPPKYIGTLAHELFHYSAPYDRSCRNEIILKIIIGVALTEFISILARCCGYSKDEDYWREFFFKSKSDKEIFNNLCDSLLVQTRENIARKAGADQTLDKMRIDQIGKELLPRHFYFTKDETNITAYSPYYMIWENIRHMMQKNQEEHIQKGIEWDEPILHRMMFGLEDVSVKDSAQERSCRILNGMNECSKVEYEQEIYFRIIRKADHKRIKAFHKLLQTVYSACLECPADIFDIETVLCDCSDNQEGRYKKITQYLWQIQGAKSAAQSTSEEQQRNAENTFQSTYGELTKNDIRIAMIVKSYLKDGETLDAVLQNWAPSGGKYAPKFGYAKDEFQVAYDQVMARFTYLLEDYSEICKGIRDRVSSIIQKNKECREKVKRLGIYYKRFYTALYERQREVYGAATEEIFRDNMFQICWRMIEEYSFNQKVFDISKAAPGKGTVVNNVSNQAELAESNSHKYQKPKSLAKAVYAADLMWKVNEGVRKMSLKDKRPILWYRGQEDRDWDTLPNIMRLKSDAGTDGFLEQLQNELHMAKAYIMPTGENFSDAEWLAYMQHYEFKTNLLDFSESLYPALYFATETWGSKEKPSKDAVVMLFNPVLFNLVMSVLEEHDNNPDSEAEKLAQKRLQEYLVGKRERYEDLPLLAKEPIDDQYRFLFDYKSFTDESKVRYPRAAMVPRHNERMTKQYGEFVFYGLNAKKKKGGLSGYKGWSLESLQQQYVDYFQSHRAQLYGLEDVQEERDVFVPFLYRIDISARHHGGFKEILASLGIRKYTVYPEYDKLAKDLAEQLHLE